MEVGGPCLVGACGGTTETIQVRGGGEGVNVERHPPKGGDAMAVAVRRHSLALSGCVRAAGTDAWLGP